MKEKLKFRWVNGFGFEDGTKIPYSYYIEVNGIKLILNACDVERFMKENHLTTNDFRGTKEKKLTKALYKYCQGVKENV